MQFSNSILAFLFYALCTQQALSAPVAENGTDLVVLSGTGNSKSDPIKAELNIKNDKHSALAFDADCWAILCKGQPKVLQRVDGKTRDNNRGKSGANAQPFKDTSKYSIKALPPKSASWSNDQDFNSAEEYPFASSLQGGDGAILMPVNIASQNSQGGSLNGFYRANKINQFNPADPKKTQGTWYQITKFTGDTTGPYCKALGGNDKSVCDANKNTAGPWGFDPAKWAYKYDLKTKKYSYVGK